MFKHPILTIGVVVVAVGAVYKYLLTDEAKKALADSGKTIAEKGKELGRQLELINDNGSDNTVEKAQQWAKEQWVKAGY